MTYKFRIINFYKRSSMYNRGLRPLLYSVYSNSVSSSYMNYTVSVVVT